MSIEVTFLEPIARAKASTWRRGAVARIIREHPNIVVISNRSWYNIVAPGTEEALYPEMDGYADVWKAGLATTIEEIRPHVGSIVVLGDTPRLSASAPDCIAQHADYATMCTKPRSNAVSKRILDAERAVAEATGSTFIDPTDWLCTSDACPAVIGRHIVYMDTAHLTIPFAETLTGRLGSLLRPAGP